MMCPHCEGELEDDGISLSCAAHGPIEISDPGPYVPNFPPEDDDDPNAPLPTWHVKGEAEC